ncbi:uncharacterized protein PV09_03371 [Verruconis gallopava]|uniref:Poly(A) RNA polymerase mitochondrial-like central palm domain-containing protein n=1 Tax=Verruconis gallopava TaxID=253628 RepID=A0A0D1YXT3_9PEZI|nr:uncharacterized protein PV09_03371 [Verruconis gallopava]KIW05487.1 hypothetical protein PV09_03371 [Verruconis gallopava]
MVINRSIFCNAANAFRPAVALNNVFLQLSFQRLIASQAGRREAEPELDVAQPEQRSDPLDHPRLQASSALPNADAQEQKERAIASEDGSGNINKAIKQSANIQATAENFRSKKATFITKKKLAVKEKEVLEYEGRYVQPVVTYALPVSRQPWIRRLEGKKVGSKLNRIGAEVKSFADWIRPTEAEAAAREAVIAETMTIVRKRLPQFDVEVFGSSRNGLALATSDIDLRIFRKDNADERSSRTPENSSLPPRWKTRMANNNALSKLQESFLRHPDYLFSNIRHARYPLLHMQHKPSGYDVQIVCANDTSKQRALIQNYLEKKPHLFDLYAVLKATLDLRGLSDVFRGGLGSYNILIMILAALDLYKPTKMTDHTQLSEMHKLGFDLLFVLKFYGTILDTYKYAVSANPFEITPKLDPADVPDSLAFAQDPSSSLRILDHSQPYLLCLEDPVDSGNDLGRKAYGWKHIQKTLQQLYEGLSRRQHPYDDQKRLTSYITELVGSALPSYNARRAKAEQYGLEVINKPSENQERIRQSMKSMFRGIFVARSKMLNKQKGSQSKSPREETAAEAADSDTRVVDKS